MADTMIRQFQGKVEEVGIYPVGAECIVAAPIGATAITVDSVGSFSEYGGTLNVNFEFTVPYLSIDEDNSTIILSTALTVAVNDETPIYQEPYAEERLAIVRSDESEDSITCRIPHSLQATFEDGIRGPGLQETVLFEVDSDGEYVIVEKVAEDVIYRPESLNIPDITQLEADLAVLEADLNNLNTVTIPQLQTDLTANQQSLDNLNNVVIPQMDSDLTAAQTNLDNLNNVVIPQLNTDLTNANNRIDSVESVNASQASDLATLNNTTIPNLQSSLNTNTTQINTLNDTTIPNLNTNINTAQGQIDTLNNTTIPGLNATLAAGAGGVNLLTASRTLTGTPYSQTSSGVTQSQATIAGPLIDSAGSYPNVTATRFQVGANGMNLRIREVKQPGWHTLTFWARADTTNVTLTVDITDLEMGTAALTTTWQRFTMKAQSRTTLDATYNFVDISAPANSDFYIYQPMLAFGQISVPYDISPEEAAADLAAERARIDTLNNTTIPNLNTALNTEKARIDTLNNTTIPNINTDISNANTAIAQRTRTIFQTSQPTGLTANDRVIWYDTDDGHRGYYWNGSAWSSYQLSNAAILPGGIVTSHMTANTISGDVITAGTLQAAKIVANSLTSSQIQAGGIAADRIVANSITTSQITAGGINGDRITANTIAADRIVANSIATGQLTANGINGDRITAGTLNADKIISGSITTTQMTANTINGDRIAANTLAADKITANSITTSQITASGINGDRITANTLNADRIIVNTLNGDRIIANTIQGDRIVANTMNADRIVANTITGDKIAANAISTTKLSIGDFTNYAPDGDLQDPTFSNWDNNGLTRVAPTGTTPGYIEWSTVANGNAHRYNLHFFEVKPGDEFYLTCEVSTPSTNTVSVTPYGAVQTYDASGGTVTWPQFTGPALAPNTGWTTMAGKIVIPAGNGVQARFDPFASSGATGGQIIRMRNMQLRKKSAGTLIIDGSIVTNHMTSNTINGDRISAGTLNADKIVAGSITTTQFTSNTISGGVVTAGTVNGDKITANTLNGDRIIANTINGDRVIANTINGDRIIANTMSADRIVANTFSGYSITGAIITGGTVQTATSGARVVMDGSLNEIQFFSGVSGETAGYLDPFVDVNATTVPRITLKPGLTSTFPRRPSLVMQANANATNHASTALGTDLGGQAIIGANTIQLLAGGTATSIIQMSTNGQIAITAGSGSNVQINSPTTITGAATFSATPTFQSFIQMNANINFNYNGITTCAYVNNNEGNITFNVINATGVNHPKLSSGSNYSGFRLGTDPSTAGNGSAITITNGSWVAATTDNMNAANTSSTNTRPFFASTINGYGAYVNASDQRFKTDIKDVDPAEAMRVVRAIRMRSFRMTDVTGVDANRTQYGVIAQEAREVLPSMIFPMHEEMKEEDEDHRLAASYQDLWAMSVVVIQDLVARVEELETLVGAR